MTLRFVLDHHIDVAAAKVLRRRGWEVVTLSELGIYDAADEYVAVIANERGAIAVTSDKAFSKWRRSRLIGNHVFMRCPDDLVAEVLDARIDETADVLARKDNIFVRLSQHETIINHPRWDP